MKYREREFYFNFSLWCTTILCDTTYHSKHSGLFDVFSVKDYHKHATAIAEHACLCHVSNELELNDSKAKHFGTVVAIYFCRSDGTFRRNIS